MIAVPRVSGRFADACYRASLGTLKWIRLNEVENFESAGFGRLILIREWASEVSERGSEIVYFYFLR